MVARECLNCTWTIWHVSHRPISCDFTTPPFRFSLCRYMLFAFVICISARAQFGRCISLLYICNPLPSRAAPFHSHGHQNPSSASGREGSSRESREVLAEGCRGTTRGAALRVPSTFVCCRTFHVYVFVNSCDLV